MNPAEIAAYIGAAAWAPQITAWAYRRFAKPRVRLIPQASVELGYTTFGAIFNVRFAMSTKGKDAVVERIGVTIQHEQGERHEFVWMGMRETFSEITDAQGNRQVVERDQPAIAVKLSTAILLEKLVRFQEPSYHEAHRPLVEALVSEHHRLKAAEVDYRQQVLGSKEFSALMAFYKTRFWWKSGQYTATFAIRSPDRAELTPGSYRFRLPQYDVDALGKNLDVIRVDYTNSTMSDVADYQAAPVLWSWRNVPLSPT